ncbi:MAG: hypothetical protein GWP05_01315 [Anaerolineaceae bacterium]|nr:hypothetical protein [Anaerolineaceae bacterium]
MHETEKKITEASRLIYFFGDKTCEGDPNRKDVLGGKGASLAEMSCAGLAVPPGFTISIPCCRYYHQHDGQWPDGLEGELRAYVARLEKSTGKRFGEGADPLLVSVRSGAAQSMPGMMDTILNCGLHPGLEDQAPDEAHFWAVYARFIQQFAGTVAGIAIPEFDHLAKNLGRPAEFEKALAEAYIDLYERESGRKFPVTAWEALCECINAVFESWDNERAHIYRKAHGLGNHRRQRAVDVQLAGQRHRLYGQSVQADRRGDHHRKFLRSRRIDRLGQRDAGPLRPGLQESGNQGTSAGPQGPGHDRPGQGQRGPFVRPRRLVADRGSDHRAGPPGAEGRGALRLPGRHRVGAGQRQVLAASVACRSRAGRGSRRGGGAAGGNQPAETPGLRVAQ